MSEMRCDNSACRSPSQLGACSTPPFGQAAYRLRPPTRTYSAVTVRSPQLVSQSAVSPHSAVPLVRSPQPHQKKGPRLTGRAFLLLYSIDPKSYAARFAESTGASGTGPQM